MGLPQEDGEVSRTQVYDLTPNVEVGLGEWDAYTSHHTNPSLGVVAS
uniref:Uncharacterized protein n=1 Tax=Musa balbisiana TaxID=52838 RepID=B5RHT2_MUSBA|nr:uncharacterized protein [Musa balbisiana]BAG70991.1 uncharacterized protein [Musa balbisiana]